jgi:FKBP12-rapamycin complex-associated protein
VEKAFLRRKGALIALSKIISVTGWAIEPYHTYPNLLPALIELIKTEEKEQLRKLAQRAIGTLGALNPTVYAQIV